MSDTLLIHTIAALRVLVAVEWGVIGVVGTKAISRIARGNTGPGDLSCASWALIAYGLTIFQWQALSGAVPPQPNQWFAIALLSFALSGGYFFAQRVFHAPREHQRAIITTHVGIVTVLLAAGALS